MRERLNQGLICSLQVCVIPRLNCLDGHRLICSLKVVGGWFSIIPVRNSSNCSESLFAGPSPVVNLSFWLLQQTFLHIFYIVLQNVETFVFKRVFSSSVRLFDRCLFSAVQLDFLLQFHGNVSYFDSTVWLNHTSTSGFKLILNALV